MATDITGNRLLSKSNLEQKFTQSVTQTAPVSNKRLLTHVRISDPLFTHVLFPFYVGTLIWVGLYLCDHRLRALIPLVGGGRK